MGDDSSKVGASAYLGPYNPSGKYRASTSKRYYWRPLDYVWLLPKIVRVVEMRNKSVSLINLQV